MRRLLLPSVLASLLITASAAANGGQHEQIEQLTAVLKDKPNDARLWLKRGELYRAHHEYAHALADYAQAELLDPGLEVIYLSRGRVMYESARFPDAYRALTQFLQMAPGHAEALFLRARTRIELGQRHAAELDFAEALANSENPAPELYLERAANLAQAGKVSAALAVLEQGMARLGALAPLEDAAINIELRARRFAPALSRIDKMLTRSERKEQLLARKAQILEASGDKVAARKVRKEAISAIEGLPEITRKLDATQKLHQELSTALASAGR
jgi:tetratricopeptide (TPR) repeat protein